MLIDSARLKKYLIKSVPNAYFERALLLFSRLDESSAVNYFQGLLQLTLLDTLFLGAWVGCRWEFTTPSGWDWPPPLLAWIPYIGSVFGAVLVVIIVATDFPDKAGVAYACLALFAAVRMLDDLVLPFTIGRKLHVHPVLSVLMLFLGVTVAGATGLVLVLPLFGVVTVDGRVGGAGDERSGIESKIQDFTTACGRCGFKTPLMREPQVSR